MNANERHHRARHVMFAMLELLTLALLVAGLSWTLLRTVARINGQVSNQIRIERSASFSHPIRLANGG